jgi:hypothetical protein
MTWIYSGMFWIFILPIFSSLFIADTGVPLFRFGAIFTGVTIATLNVYFFVISSLLFGIYYLKTTGGI